MRKNMERLWGKTWKNMIKFEKIWGKYKNAWKKYRKKYEKIQIKYGIKYGKKLINYYQFTQKSDKI
jgi:hypothetical protein